MLCSTRLRSRGSALATAACDAAGKTLRGAAPTFVTLPSPGEPFISLTIIFFFSAEKKRSGGANGAAAAPPSGRSRMIYDVEDDMQTCPR
jgi:hypothetical protein